MIASAIVYAGLIASFLGLISLLKPLKFLGIRSRRRGAQVLGCGVLLVLVAFSLPAAEVQIETPRTHLDEFAPAYQFHEFHSIEVNASRERAYDAIKQVRAGEIRFFTTLTTIRRGGRPGPESILNAPENMPILEVARRTSFLLLAEEPGREIVVGTLVAAPAGWQPKGKRSPEGYKALREPGFVLATMNFRIEDGARPAQVRVTTETRVFATDDSARRRFAPYWRTIYPGSALIRIMWLRAIKKRAESSTP